MAGGSLVNACLDLLTPRGRFALRLRIKQGPRAGADTRRELKLQRLAATAGLAPAVLEADPAAGWMLMEFVDANHWSVGQLQQVKRVDALMGRVRLLQTLPVVDELAFDPMALLQLQLSLSNILEPSWQGPLQDLLRAAEPLILECAVQPGRAVAAHGDLNVGNLLGSKPMLIDWEYAQFADPLHDLACLLAYYPQLEPRSRHLLGQLGRDDPENRERLALQKRLWGLINGLWKSLHGG
jgi:thiamine kinase